MSGADSIVTEGSSVDMSFEQRDRDEGRASERVLRHARSGGNGSAGRRTDPRIGRPKERNT